MAMITFFRDDFDGTEDSTVRPRRVMLEEGTLVIDLSDDNYAGLMALIEPFMDKGEWTERETGDSENALIRKWARDNGKDVSPRGRLPRDLVTEYREAQKRAAATDTADGNVTPDASNPGSDSEPREAADNGDVSAPVSVDA